MLALVAGTTTPGSAVVAPVAPGPSAPPSSQSSNLSVVAQARGSSVAVFAILRLRRPTKRWQARPRREIHLCFSYPARDQLDMASRLPAKSTEREPGLDSQLCGRALGDGFLIDVNLPALMTVVNDGHVAMSIHVGEVARRYPRRPGRTTSSTFSTAEPGWRVRSGMPLGSRPL